MTDRSQKRKGLPQEILAKVRLAARARPFVMAGPAARLGSLAKAGPAARIQLAARLAAQTGPVARARSAAKAGLAAMAGSAAIATDQVLPLRVLAFCGAPDNVSLAEPAAKTGHAAKERHAANIELVCLRFLCLRLLLCAQFRLKPQSRKAATILSAGRGRISLTCLLYTSPSPRDS